MKDENYLSSIVIKCAIEVHRELGAGLLESAYEACLAYELRAEGLEIEVQKSLPLRYKGVDLGAGYRLDIVVEGKLILELKAVECFEDIHIAQALTYLKLTNSKLCLLLNFNVPLMKEGIKRVVLNL
jgi:GxxExxY protein